MNKSIPLSVPSFQGNELRYVSEAINTEWVSTGGKFIDQFQDEISKYLKVNNAVACQSGTAGLHIALTLANVDSNCEVIVPTLTFIATVNPVKYVGAAPIFMDCDDNLCLDADKLEEFVYTQCTFSNGNLINKTTLKVIKALIYVHVFGNSGAFEKVYSLCKEYNIRLIEDATESLGTYFIGGIFAGRFTGTIGDFGVYSFNGNKIITTGGGGMLVCANVKDAKRALYLTTQAKDDEVRFIHNEVGYNYRMTNLQAALGLAQLENLERYIAIKKRNYLQYAQLLINNGLKLLEFNPLIRPNFWFYSLMITEQNFSNLQLMDYLLHKNIQTRPIWHLNHFQIPYKDAQAYKITKAQFYWERILNIPCSANLQELDIVYVSNLILSFSVKNGYYN